MRARAVRTRRVPPAPATRPLRFAGPRIFLSGANQAPAKGFHKPQTTLKAPGNDAPPSAPAAPRTERPRSPGASSAPGRPRPATQCGLPRRGCGATEARARAAPAATPSRLAAANSVGERPVRCRRRWPRIRQERAGPPPRFVRPALQTVDAVLSRNRAGLRPGGKKEASRQQRSCSVRARPAACGPRFRPRRSGENHGPET